MRHFSATEILVLVLVLVAAGTDIRWRKIPNWLTLSGILAGFGVNCWLSGWAGLATSGEGLLLGFGVYIVLYALRAMGAGDVKLMAAVGSVVGPTNWILVFIASALAGGVLAVALMIRSGRAKQTLWNSFFIVGELMHFRAPYERRKDLDVRDPRALNMPHGVAIAAGTMVCLWFALV
jgi:prepilin peptidase CpaA